MIIIILFSLSFLILSFRFARRKSLLRNPINSGGNYLIYNGVFSFPATSHPHTRHHEYRNNGKPKIPAFALPIMILLLWKHPSISLPPPPSPIYYYVYNHRRLDFGTLPRPRSTSSLRPYPCSSTHRRIYKMRVLYIFPLDPKSC